MEYFFSFFVLDMDIKALLWILIGTKMEIGYLLGHVTDC